MIDITVGGDWGTSAITMEPDSGQLAVIDADRQLTVHTEIGGPAAEVRLASGEPTQDNAMSLDKLGRLPRHIVTLDVDDQPQALYFHPLDAGPGEEWYVYRLHGASSSGGSPGGGSIADEILQRLPATPLTTSIRWGWAGSDIASGVVSQGARLRTSCDLTTLAAYAVGDVGAAETRIEWVWRPDSGLEVPVGSVSIPAGQPWAEQVLATPVRLTGPGFLLPTLAAAPPAGGAGATALSRVAATATSTGTTTAGPSSPFTAPMPVGGTAGDIVVVAVSCQAPDPAMPSGWTRVAASASTGVTPQSRTSVFWAPWSATLDMTVALTAYTPTGGGATISSSPIRATAMILRGAPGTTPIPVSVTTATANNAGAVVTTPAVTPAQPVDQVYVAAGWRTNSGVSGQAAAGPGTELADAMTTRDPASSTNVGQAVYVLPAGYAAGEAIPAQTVTMSGGTGGVTSLSTSAVLFGVRRQPATPAPVRIEGEVLIEALTVSKVGMG